MNKKSLNRKIMEFCMDVVKCDMFSGLFLSAADDRLGERRLTLNVIYDNDIYFLEDITRKRRKLICKYDQQFEYFGDPIINISVVGISFTSHLTPTIDSSFDRDLALGTILYDENGQLQSLKEKIDECPSVRCWAFAVPPASVGVEYDILDKVKIKTRNP